MAERKWLGSFPGEDLSALIANIATDIPVVAVPGGPALAWLSGFTVEQDALVADLELVSALPATPVFSVLVEDDATDPETGESIGPRLQTVLVQELSLTPPVAATARPQDAPAPAQPPKRAPPPSRPFHDPSSALLGVMPGLSRQEADRYTVATELQLMRQPIASAVELAEHPNLNAKETRAMNTNMPMPTADQMLEAREEARRSGRPFREALQAVQLNATRTALAQTAIGRRVPAVAPITAHAGAPARAPSAPAPNAPATNTQNVGQVILSMGGRNPLHSAKLYLSRQLPGWERMDNETQFAHARSLCLQHGLIQPPKQGRA